MDMPTLLTTTDAISYLALIDEQRFPFRRLVGRYCRATRQAPRALAIAAQHERRGQKIGGRRAQHAQQDLVPHAFDRLRCVIIKVQRVLTIATSPGRAAAAGVIAGSSGGVEVGGGGRSYVAVAVAMERCGLLRWRV